MGTAGASAGANVVPGFWLWRGVAGELRTKGRAQGGSRHLKLNPAFGSGRPGLPANVAQNPLHCRRLQVLDLLGHKILRRPAHKLMFLDLWIKRSNQLF